MKKTTRSELKKRYSFYFSSILLSIVITCLLTNTAMATVSSKVYQVEGCITDSITGDGLSYVTVIVQSDTQGIVKKMASEANGNFTLEIESIGTYNLYFQNIGYDTGSYLLVLNENENNIDIGTISLHETTEELEEIQVTALQQLVKIEADKLVYNMEADPEAETQNALEMLRKVPLVEVDGEDNIKLMGQSNVRFLMNGKTSIMLSQNVSDVLKSIPANTIKDIEVITNPSSKYDAEGTSGIINIITTKKQLNGFITRVNAGINSQGSANGGIYAATKINKFGLSFNYSYNNNFNAPESTSNSIRENYLSTTNRYTESDGSSKSESIYNYAMGEASYEIDSLNLLSMSFWTYSSNYSNKGETTTKDFDINRELTRHFINYINSTSKYSTLSGNIDFQRSYAKPDKTLTISYMLDNSPSNTDYENEVDGILDYESYLQESKNDAKGREQTFQLDYYDPISQVHQLGTGIKYILRQNKSNSDILLFDPLEEIWESQEAKINDLNYDQHIIGLYSEYVMQQEKYSIKAGLRAEVVINNGMSKSYDEVADFTNKMFNLVPYITYSKTLNNGQNINLSYTQRLSRPSIYYLNPYVNDSDPLNINYGNPELESEVLHKFTFTYMKFTQKLNFNFSLSSYLSNNSIMNVLSINPEGVVTRTYDNIGKNNRYISSLYTSYQLNQKFSISSNLSLQYIYLENQTDRSIKNEGFRYTGYMNVRFIPWENGTISGYGGLYSAGIQLQGETSLNHYSGISITQKTSNDRFSFTLSVNDPFRKTYNNKYLFVDESYIETKNFNSPSRSFGFNISYRIGQMSESIKKAKRGISNDDLLEGDTSSGS